MVDYDIELQYHPVKVNTVPDSLSRKPEYKVLVQLTQQKELLRQIIKLDLMLVQGTGKSGQLIMISLHFCIFISHFPTDL